MTRMTMSMQMDARVLNFKQFVTILFCTFFDENVCMRARETYLHQILVLVHAQYPPKSGVQKAFSKHTVQQT